MKVIKILKNRIKNIMILITLSFTFFSCTMTEYPEFVGMENLKIIDKKFKTFTLSVDAKFENPNDVGGTLQTDNLKVFINDVEAAIIKTEEFNVPSKDVFTVPMVVKISTDKIVNTKSIGGILNSMQNKTIKVRYEGDMNYEVAGFSSTYDVDYSDELKF